MNGLLKCCAIFAAAVAAAAPARAAEVPLSNEEFKKLEVFEGHALTKADKVFNSGEYRQAAAEYDSFLLEFPKSKALAYALLRKARCLDLEKKRYQAIQAYQEVLDYFPNAVRYAAAAQYYIGKCHWDNGDVDKAMKAWAAMADDEDYRKQDLAASAINYLADNLVKQNKVEQAVGYYRQVAVDFRADNAEASNYAIDKVAEHYVRSSPNEPALRAFHQAVKGFERKRKRLEDNLDNSREYWGMVQNLVERHGRFADSEAELKDHYYRYWADQMTGKFPDWDAFQITAASFRLACEKDPAKWAQRLDEQFAKYQKAGDFDRVIRWISAFRRQKNKVEEYYAKLDFSKMTVEQIQELMRVLFDDVGDAAMAKNVFEKIPLGKLKDEQKTTLARYFWKRDGELVQRVCAGMEDKDLGQMELLRYCHFAQNARLGLPVAEGLLGHPKYAAEATWMKAELLEWSKQYAKAIAAYQQADNPPKNLWRIADCYAAMGKVEPAVGQLQEIENFFKDQSSAAALKIAHVYRAAGREKEYVARLRYVLSKYPKSPQSSTAHQELERMGKRIGGGVDAE